MATGLAGAAANTLPSYSSVPTCETSGRRGVEVTVVGLQPGTTVEVILDQGLYSPVTDPSGVATQFMSASPGPHTITVYYYGALVSPGVSTVVVPSCVPGFVGISGTPDGKGYWLARTDGKVQPFGDAVNYGQVPGFLNQAVVGIQPTHDGKGYWLVASDGGVFAFGDAVFYGSMGGQQLNEPVVGMAATSDGNGYWLVASDGGIFSFGDATFQGSMGGQLLNRPVVGMASDSATGGYWLVASDGGVFAFRAPFLGSTGNIMLVQPAVGMASMADGSGYRFVAADGGIFCFNAPFAGSNGGQASASPYVGMAADGTTAYWIVDAGGAVTGFGGAINYGNGSVS
jgi:hypothetical protein